MATALLTGIGRVGLAVMLLGLADARAQSTGPAVGRPLAERPVLRVGASTDSFPYSYVEKDGRLAGFMVDVMDAVARVMNLRITRVTGLSQDIQNRFRAGEFDLLQSLSQTAEREAYAQFSVPFLTHQGAVFVRKGGPIRQLADLHDQPFAIVGSGSIAEQFLRRQGLRIKPLYISSTAEALRQIEAGQCAGVFASYLTTATVIEHDGFRHIRMLGDPLPDYDIRHCFPVHPGDAQLLARLNEGLAILHRTGEYERIFNRWFGHIGSPLISRQEVLTYAAGLMALALIAMSWALLHQRRLRQRIAGQAAELARQQALLQTLYDHIPMGMCVLEAAPEGPRVLSINRQAESFFGLPATQVTGRPLAALTAHPEWLQHLGELLSRGAAAGSHLREERRLTAANRRVIFTLVPMTPDPAGHPRLCVLVEDITERRNLDEEIAQSRKLRAVGELVGGIAHEFNNLLTPIMLKVGEIQHNWAHDPRLVAETRLIAEAVQRSAELTRRLLTFGRKSDPRLEEVHLGTIINNCFSLLRLTVERRIHWEQSVPPGLPPIYFSPTSLNQILLNLVINARDTLLDKLAAHRGEWTPCIRVEVALLPAEAVVRPAGDPSQRQVLGWQRLTVRDNGMGMTPEVRERAFEPFFTTKDVGKGTGLGLATVWHLVTEVSGRIEIESTAGEGTAFHVFLPMLPAPAASIPAAPRVAEQQSSAARIFLAEDDDLVANAVITTLQKVGHEVTRLADGAAAWSHLQDRLPVYDLLVFDVNMPGLDGIELAQRVRGKLRFTGPIMITSGRLGSDDLEELTEARVSFVLNKPFAITELMDAVRHCLATPRPA